MHVLAEFGTGQFFWSLFWFVLFVIWIWLLIIVFGDIFRSADLSGWGKALWVIFVIILPYLGVFIYLIARGGKMHERHQAGPVAAYDDATWGDLQSAAEQTSTSPADELTQLADLRAQGVIGDAEYESLKAKVIK